MLYLSNALIFDGNGGPPLQGGLLIRDGRIVDFGDVAPPTDADEIDLRGCALSPGFIDLHSHSDLAVLENRKEKSDQGITSEVVGNCGFSAYPCGDSPQLLSEQNQGILHGTSTWSNATEYLDSVRRSSHLVRVESLVGHGALRTAVYGKDAGSPKLDRLDTMIGILDEALSQGAIGFSTGLMYAPGSEAPLEELEALCRVVAKHGKLYTTHMRSYSWQLVESVEEQIGLARRTGCRIQISHLQAVGRDNWHKQRLALDRIERAHKEGIDIGFDCYPYLAGSTVMTQLLPQSALKDGIAGLLALIADSSSRVALRHALETETAQAWSDIFVSSVCTTGNRQLVGRNIAQIAEQRCASPAETVLDLLVEESGKVNITAFNQSEPNLRELLTHSLSSIITDGFYVSERPHPRLAGAFPTLLGEFVRLRGWLSLSEAVRKITSLPAERLHLVNAGKLTCGGPADLTIFDPALVGSEATFEHPTAAPSGIHLIVRGQQLLPKSSSLIDEYGILLTGQALPHATLAHPSTPERSGELHYER